MEVLIARIVAGRASSHSSSNSCIKAKLALHNSMESLDSVALGVVHWSGSGSHVKGCHCDLEDVCHESRPIVRVNYGRDSTIRKVIPDKVLDHRLGLLVLDGPGCKPSSIYIDDCEERGVSLLGRL